MENSLIENEPAIRAGFFATIFLLMAILEVIIPCRSLLTSKSTRWITNLGIVTLNSLLVRLIFPITAIEIAALAETNQWGLFNLTLLTGMPDLLVIVLCVITLDFFIYLQHVLFHHVPLLWRLHMMHHTDLDIDVTTGARFHPIEIILSMLIKMTAIIVLGAPAIAVLIFEILLNATAMFNHSNIKLAGSVDRLLRWFVVTPDMHRVHHSTIKMETNSNYGFNLPWWDHLFNTYRDQPEGGHVAMTIGLEYFRDPKSLSFFKLMLLPLSGKMDNYPPRNSGRDV